MREGPRAENAHFVRDHAIAPVARSLLPHLFMARMTTMLVAGLLVAAGISCKQADEGLASGEERSTTGDEAPINERSGAFVYSVSAENKGLNFEDFSARKIDGAKMFNRGPLAAKGVERMPFVLFRIVPELALALTGKRMFGENFEPFGFFMDTRPGQKGWPVPVGFTFTVPEPSKVSYVIRTCASCHVGRVRVGDEVQIVDGAPNTEMDFHAYTTTWNTFVHRAFEPGARSATKAAIVRLLESKDPSWFYNGQSSYRQNGQEAALGADEVKAQIKLVEDDFDAIAEDVFAASEFAVSVGKGMDSGFHRAPVPADKQQSTASGPRGILDSNSNGIYSIINAYNQSLPAINKTLPADEQKPTFDVSTLYAGATKVSIPSVWQQDRRKAAQWTASVTDIFFRNAIAAMGFATAGQDLNGLHLSVVSKYVRDLPAPKFPMEVDATLAADGKAVYEAAKCATCHVAVQKELPPIFKMGTSPNRSRSSTPGVGAIVGPALLGTCLSKNGNAPGNLALAITIGGETQKPCVTDYAKISLPRDTEELHGYPAMPLDGLWARAPFLHNGSVPTLYHLLASNKGASVRPSRFAVGSIGYDPKNVGFAWQVDAGASASGAVYDTSLDGFMNGGHAGTDARGMWTDPSGKAFKLSWDVSDAGEKAKLLALLEYLKTM